jgi:hypothetical protein
MTAQAPRHFNSRRVECAECGHLGRGLPELCACCAGAQARPVDAAADKREREAAREENRQ